jgi:SRSO17 transposase
MLIVAETGFLTKDQKSVGIASTYTGTAADINNGQVGVSFSATPVGCSSPRKRLLAWSLPTGLAALPYATHRR